MLKKLKQLAFGARVLLARGGDLTAVDLHGTTIQVRHGGDGPPFVYLHSSLGEIVGHWLPFLDQWAKRFGVYAPVHPGFGRSGGFEHVRDVEDLAFHYVELFDALGLEEFYLGGVSLGGWIAAEFACRWPERVRRLWLCNAPGLWVEGQPFFNLFRYLEQPAKLREALFHDPAGPFATLVLRDRGQVKEEELIQAYQHMTVLARLVWERPYDPKLERRLRRIACPTLVLAGASDRLVPPAYGERYAQLIPGAKFQVLPQCGHLPMFEQEAAFVDAVARFCQEG